VPWAISETAPISANNFRFFVRVGAMPNMPIPAAASSINTINADIRNVLLRYFINYFECMSMLQTNATTHHVLWAIDYTTMVAKEKAG